MNYSDFFELLKQICKIASKVMELDEERVWRNIDVPSVEFDCFEYVAFMLAVEEKYSITLAGNPNNSIQTLLDIAMYVYNYDFFLHEGEFPSVTMDEMIAVRNKMRPTLVDLWGEEKVSQLYIYSPESIDDMNRLTEDYLEWNMLPNNWALCFDDDCPLREKCVRWQTWRIMPDEIYCAMCVMPCSRIDDNCWMYVKKDNSITYKELFNRYKE